MYLKFVNDLKQEGRRLQIEEEEEEEQPIRPMVQKVRVTDQTLKIVKKTSSKMKKTKKKKNDEKLPRLQPTLILPMLLSRTIQLIHFHK